MIYWLQEATQAGAQAAASSWPSVLLNNAVVGAVVGFVGVLIGQYLQQHRHSQTLEQTAAAQEQAQARHSETLRHTAELETQRANKAAELEAQRAHEAALQKYFEQVGKLLIEQAENANLGTVARAQTLAVLEGLDPERKRILLQFLHESDLIKEDKSVVNLTEANLVGANLEGTRSFTQEQINQATGDETTKLPDHLQRPAHWKKASSEGGEE